MERKIIWKEDKMPNGDIYYISEYDVVFYKEKLPEFAILRPIMEYSDGYGPVQTHDYYVLEYEDFWTIHKNFKVRIDSYPGNQMDVNELKNLAEKILQNYEKVLE